MNLNMKKNITFLFFVLQIGTLIGQNLKIQIGPTFSKLNWENSMVDETVYNNNITGVSVLIGIDYLNFKYFNLSSNIGFIQKGGKDSVFVVAPLGGVENKGLLKIKLNYLTVNTTANLKFPIKDFVIPYLFVGPRIDYLISYKEDAVVLQQFDDMGILNKLIYGVLTGVGIDFKIKKFFVGAVFDYYFNFNKIVDNTSDTNVSNEIIDRTFTIDLKVGYKM